MLNGNVVSSSFGAPLAGESACPTLQYQRPVSGARWGRRFRRPTFSGGRFPASVKHSIVQAFGSPLRYRRRSTSCSICFAGWKFGSIFKEAASSSPCASGSRPRRASIRAVLVQQLGIRRAVFDRRAVPQQRLLPVARLREFISPQIQPFAQVLHWSCCTVGTLLQHLLEFADRRLPPAAGSSLRWPDRNVRRCSPVRSRAQL